MPGAGGSGSRRARCSGRWASRAPMPGRWPAPPSRPTCCWPDSACSMLVVAVVMLLRRRVQAQPSRAVVSTGARHTILVAAAATGVGLITGFFGVGGGFVVVPALGLVLGFDMPTAVGTSLLVIAINSASALLSRLGTHASIGDALLITFTAAAVAGAIAGSRIP